MATESELAEAQRARVCGPGRQKQGTADDKEEQEVRVGLDDEVDEHLHAVAAIRHPSTTPIRRLKG